MNLSREQKTLLSVLQNGIPLVPRPFEEIAKLIDSNEKDVINELSQFCSRGIIRRMGVIVRHRNLGYSSNAMCVWDIPDEIASHLGQKMKEFHFVTLCYRRKRSLPIWPYNLYCMIHGKTEEQVYAQLKELTQTLQLEKFPHQILFSRKEFKQRGAHYFIEPEKKLLNLLQAGLPVNEQPYKEISKQSGYSEEEILEKIKSWLKDGTLSRFGPLYNVEKMGGTFILAAMKVPQGRFEEVNKIVNDFTEVAHNYEREHALNMWFVVATSTYERAYEVIAEIQNKTGIDVLAMPKEKEFFLELKFEA